MLGIVCSVIAFTGESSLECRLGNDASVVDLGGNSKSEARTDGTSALPYP